MRRTTLTILLLISLILAQTATLWAHEATPTVICADLDSQDCEVLATSAAAMRALRGQRVDSTMLLELSKVPRLIVDGNQLDFDHLALEITSESQYSLNEDAHRGLQIFSEVHPNLLTIAALAAPESMWTIINGISAEIHLEITMSDSLQAYLAEGAGEEIPAKLIFTLRLVEGILYINAEELAETLGQPLPSDIEPWLSVDLREFAERVASESEDGPAAGAILPMLLVFGMSQRSDYSELYNDLQTLGELDPDITPGALIQVKRGRDRTVSGQKAAIFTTTTDLGALTQWVSDVLQNMIVQFTPEPEMAMLVMLSMTPGLVHGVEILNQQAIDLEDHHLLRQETNLTWNMVPIMAALRLMAQNAGNANDQSFRVLDRNPKGPLLHVESNTIRSDFNQEFDIQAPSRYTELPLDEIMQ